jgi:hypothetical protein
MIIISPTGVAMFMASEVLDKKPENMGKAVNM